MQPSPHRRPRPDRPAAHRPRRPPSAPARPAQRATGGAPGQEALPDKRAELQQHDLTAPAARAIIDCAAVRRGHVVLEIGAGRGALTALMLDKEALVHVVEKDPERCQLLATRFAAQVRKRTLILHQGDAAEIGPPLSGLWRAVANPPFNLTATLLRRWLLEPNGDQPEALDLVLQYEAARKLCGRDGAHTHSSVLCRLVGKPWISLPLRRDDVQPPSRVDLCLWSLRKLASAPPPQELRAIDRLLDLGFAGPHSVAEALRGVATGIQLRRQGDEHGWNPAQHPRELKPVAWRSLAALLVLCRKI